MLKKGKKPWKKSGKSSSFLTTTKKTFRLQTKWCKDVFFTSVTAKDTVHFTGTIDQLSRYVDTSGWKQDSEFAKVVTNPKDPVLIVPARPTRTYLCRLGPDAVKKTNWIALGVVNIPMVSNIDYQAAIDEYLSKKRKYEKQIEKWDENNAKRYYLVL